MRIVLALVLVLLSAAVSLAQENASMTSDFRALCKRSGNPMARNYMLPGARVHMYEIWRDHDGLRLMVLNHVALMDLCPGVSLSTPDAFVSWVRWSDDGETITTVAHTDILDSHFVEQRWSATTGELLLYDH